LRLAPVTSLNGTWMMQPEKTGLDKPKGGDWVEVPVPMPWSAFLFSPDIPLDAVPHRMAWFRRRIVIPDIPPLSRAVLHFEAVNFYAVVYVNGKRCGQHVGDGIPFEIDATDAVTPRREAEILVGVQDISYARTGDRDRRGPAAKLTFPGLAHNPGIWGGVSLRILPELRVVAVAVRTTLAPHPGETRAEGRIQVRVSVENETGRALGFSLTNEVYDGARQAVAFAPVRGAVGPGERTEVDVGTSWDSAVLWWPDRPHLYSLRTALWSTLPGHDEDAAAGMANDVVDRVHTPVGFREFRIENDRFLLNNVPIQLRSESVCPISGELFGQRRPGAAPGPVEPEQAMQVLAALKRKTGLNAVRFHRMPPSPALLDAADAVGLLAIVEFPLPDDEQRYAADDPRFWDNAQEFARQWVAAHAHHPSLVMWSIDQGMVSRYGGDVADGLRQLARVVADADPTRPVENGGDGDAVDAAQLDVSAPTSVPFPDVGVAFRTAGPYEPDAVRGRVLREPGREIAFPPRPADRPLCIMEHFRRPLTPSSLAFFLGDGAYAPSAALEEAAALLAVLEMGACRQAHLAAVNTVARPPAPQGVGDTAADVAALPRQLFANFYAGTRFVENLVLKNDTRFDQDFQLDCRFTNAHGDVSEHSEEVFVAAGAETEKSVAFDLPDVQKAHEANGATSSLAELIVKLNGSVTGSFEGRRKIAVWPRVRSAGERRIGLYDPEGHTAAALSSVGAKHSAVHGTPHGEFDTIIIGENAIERGSTPDPEAIRSFVARGGLAVCLGQGRVPCDLSPVTMILDEGHAAPITFIRDAEHCLLRGLSGFEMRWWQDDHAVAHGCFRKPSSGNFRCLVDAGGRGGLRWAAAAEVFHGRGSYIFLQMALVERAALAPVAGLLLARLADAAPSWRPAEARITEAESPLARVGVRCPALPADFSAEHLDAVEVVMLTGDDLSTRTKAQVRTLKSWVEAGGCLALHHLAPDHAGVLTELSGHPATLAESPQERLVFNRPGCGLARGLSSADLHFTDHAARYVGVAPTKVHAATATVSARGSGVTGVASALESSVEHGLLVLHAGKGRVVVDQVRWDVETRLDARAERYISTLLTNLGVPLVPRRFAPPSGASSVVDIAGACNSTLRAARPGHGEGWTGRGPDNDLGAFSPGEVIAAGALFRVTGGDGANEHNCCVLGPNSPATAPPVTLGHTAKSLAFLVACQGPASRGLPVAHFTVRYQDGLETQVPLRYGIDVLDWNERPRGLQGASVAWKGFTALGEPAAIYAKKWENGRPGVPVESVAFSSTRAGSIPVLLAMTALR